MSESKALCRTRRRVHRWTFGHSVNGIQKDVSTRVPTQITCQIFKERTAATRLREPATTRVRRGRQVYPLPPLKSALCQADSRYPRYCEHRKGEGAKPRSRIIGPDTTLSNAQ